MIGSEAVAMVKSRLMRGTAGSPALETLILTEMRAAQERLEKAPTLPEFLISEEAFQEVQLGEERIAIPFDFLREVESDNMRIEDTAGTTPDELQKTDIFKDFYDGIRQRYGNTSGRPRVYALSGGYFRVRPIPDKDSYRLWMTYYMKGGLITLDAENLWLANDADSLMGEAGVVIATAMGNQQALSLFTNLLGENRVILARNAVAREMANFEPNPED